MENKEINIKNTETNEENALDTADTSNKVAKTSRKTSKAKAKTDENTEVKASKANAKKATENSVDIDIDAILDKNLKNETKTALTFNQNKSVSDKLKAIASKRETKVGIILNEILKELVDLEKQECIIDIKEKGEEKVQSGYKIDTQVLNIFKKEAQSRNMSLNDYLNKVLGIVLK